MLETQESPKFVMTRAHLGGVENVAALCPYRTAWTHTDEGLQKHSELHRVLGKSRRCQGAGCDVVLAAFGTNELHSSVGWGSVCATTLKKMATQVESRRHQNPKAEAKAHRDGCQGMASYKREGFPTIS